MKNFFKHAPFSFDRLWQFRGQIGKFENLKIAKKIQKSKLLYCENQTGKTNSKNVESKTVTPVDGVNKTIFFNMASRLDRRFVWRDLVWSAFFYASFLLTGPGMLNDLTWNSLLLFLFKVARTYLFTCMLVMFLNCVFQNETFNRFLWFLASLMNSNATFEISAYI